MVSISITAAQLVGKVSIEGADEGQTSLKNVGQAADTLGQKLESVKPFDASKTITDVDVAEARFTLLQEKVKQAQQALQEMQDASARGEKVEGIESAEANLTILQAKAQEAGAAMYDLSISELAADTAAKETASASDQLASQEKKAGDAAQQSSGQHESLARKLLTIGSQMGQTIFGFQQLYQGAVGFGQALLGPNAAMEQTTVAFETLLGKGKATQDFLKQMQQFAAATPFTFPEVATSAQHMLAFGFSAKQVLPYLTNIGDAMSAMGKGSANIDHIVEVFGQMHAAGKLNAGDMMQLASEGIPAWKFLADAMGKTVPEVQKLSSQGLIPADKAIQAVSDGMHKMFGGGMQAQATTFNGLLSTFQDNIGMAMRAFTGPLFDMAKKGLETLGNLVSSPAFQHFATQMGQNVGKVLLNVGDMLVKYLPSWKQLGDFFTVATSKGGILQVGMHDLGDILSKVMSTVTTLSDDLWKFGTGILDAANKSGAIQSVLKTIHDILPDVANFFTRAGDDLNQNLLPPLEKLITNVGTSIKNFADWLDKSGILKTALSDLGDATNTLSGYAGTLVGWVADLVGYFNDNAPAAEALKAALLGVGSAIVAMKIVDFVNNIIDMGKNIVDAAGKFLEFAGDIKQQVMDALHTFSNKGLTEVQDALGKTRESSEATKGSFETLGPAAQTSAGEVDMASADMEKDMKGIGASADGATAQIETIGPAAMTAKGEADAATAGIEGDAAAAKTSLNTVGPSAMIAKGEADVAMAGVEADATAAKVSISGLTAMLGGLLSLINIGESTIKQNRMTPDQIKQWQKDHPGVPVPKEFTGYAEGTDDAPGGWSWVGEKGPELLYVPKGAQVVPNNQLGSMSSHASSLPSTGTPIILSIDGRQFASVILPHLASQMRYNLGVFGR